MTTTPQIGPANDLMHAVNKYLPTDRASAVEHSLDYAIKAHDGQVRESGEPFVIHPIATAVRLADMRLDATTIQAALLHVQH